MSIIYRKLSFKDIREKRKIESNKLRLRNLLLGRKKIDMGLQGIRPTLFIWDDLVKEENFG